MEKSVLIELIELLYEFDEDQKGGKKNYSVKDFIGFLNTRVGAEDITMRKIEGEFEQQLQTVRQESNSDTSILITLMFRYAKNYIKKALHGSKIQTADEFAFLITLMTYESLTKTELINKQVMEKTSGVEVIKRLVAQKMIREFADESDKRSVRVAITDAGKKEVVQVLPEMSKVSRIVVGNLTDPEINTLSYLLKKLDFFHHDIFTNKKGYDLEQILVETKKNQPSQE